ncbi:mas-related G-protein coupled receptor member A6-like [Odocoileus virginianus]|uniref:Mas-related G-protein coupled receptor member A6-like n=1 Tax=Odocoileus virginianus TaxID=9874 RepID=A0A6J0VKW5_ODOVR
MDDYCEMNHCSTDAVGLAEGSLDVGHVTLRSLTVVVSLCGLAGNGIVIWLVRLSHKKTSFLIYSLNLAIADFMNLSFQILFSVRQTLKAAPPPLLWSSCPLHGPEVVLLPRWPEHHDRHQLPALSVLFPIWYRCHCPKHLSAIVSALLWILTFLLNTLRGYACGQLFTKEKKFCDGFKTATAVLVFLQFAILGISSLLLLHRVQGSSQKHQPRRFYLVLLLSFLGFLFGLPLSIIRFYTTEKKNHIFNDICVLLCCVNSTANPAVYFFIGGLQRERPTESLKAVLQRALDEETEDAEDQKVIPAGKMDSVGL